MERTSEWREWLYTPRDFSSAKDLDRRKNWALVWPPYRRMGCRAGPEKRKGAKPVPEPAAGELFSQWLSFVSQLHTCGSQLICAEDEQSVDQVYIGDHVRLFGNVLVQGRMKSTLRRREGEVLSRILKHLARPDGYRGIEDEEATVEFGDTIVLAQRRLVFLGTTGRTNRRGLRALQRVLGDFSWRVVEADFNAGEVSHLTGAALEIGEDCVLVNPSLVDTEVFLRQSLEVVETLEGEPQAAASFWLRFAREPTLIMPDECPRTTEMLQRRGCPVAVCAMNRFIETEGVGGALCAYIHSPN